MTADQQPPGGDGVENAVLAAATVVLETIHRDRRAPRVQLESRLSEDLGLDSLAMVELIDEVEHRCKVSLPPSVLEQTGTPRDLVDSVLSARAASAELLRASRAPRAQASSTVEAVSSVAGSGALGTSPGAVLQAGSRPCPRAAAPPGRGGARVPMGSPTRALEDSTTGMVAPAPGEVATLVDAVRWHVEAHPDRCHVRLLEDADSRRRAGEPGWGELSYADLALSAVSVADAMGELGVRRGDRVALMLPTSEQYFAVFTGILVAGAVPVPIYPPSRPAQMEEHLRRQVGILANAGVRVLVTVGSARALARLVRLQVPGLRHVVLAEDLVAGALPPGRSVEGASPAALARRLASAPAGPDDLALVQYTSGSTADPKGVMLTHRQLLANMQAMGDAACVGESDVVVSWLPLYHDMGLIGTWLSSLYFAMTEVVMTPQAFLARPVRWLRALSDHGGTVSAAPNFAYELCTRRIEESELVGLDLSRWRIAMNGAEPVSAKTLTEFADRFAPYGLEARAMTPVYGLAEVGLGVAFPPIGRGLRVDWVDRAALVERKTAEPVDRGASAEPSRVIAQVSCGMALPGYEVRVVDDLGHRSADRREGHVEVRGPSTTDGYFANAGASAELYHGDWLRTGDLGYLVEGELFVTGRAKDVIIRAGRNLHPEDVEAAVGEIEGVRKGCVAAFGLPGREGTGQLLVVVAESRLSTAGEADRLREAIVGATADLVGAAADEVVIVPPGSVRKTSSGKVRRAATRQRYLGGDLRPPRRSVPWQLLRFTTTGSLPALRAVAASLSDTAFAVRVWAAFAGVGLPLLLALALVPDERSRRALVYRAARLVVQLTGASVEYDRGPGWPPGGFVAVANHASYVDAIVLAGITPPRAAFVAGEVFATQRVVGWFLRRIGAQFVVRGQSTTVRDELARFARLAGAGTALVFFPEGGLSSKVGLQRFHHGAFVVASRAGVPIVPVAMSGTRGVVAPGTRRLRRSRVEVVVGEALFPTGDTWSDAVELGERARQVLLAQLDEPDLDR